MTGQLLGRSSWEGADGIRLSLNLAYARENAGIRCGVGTLDYLNSVYKKLRQRTLQVGVGSLSAKSVHCKTRNHPGELILIPACNKLPIILIS
jgi:hypothetical protein